MKPIVFSMGIFFVASSLFYLFGMPLILSYGEDRLFIPHAMIVGLIGLFSIYSGIREKRGNTFNKTK